MEAFEIEGGFLLNGTVTASGAKNAALPMMASAILTEEPLQLNQIPNLADIRTMMSLLINHGVTCGYDKMEKSATLHATKITDTMAPYDLVRTMRASVLVLGPLLAREGNAKVSLPGGCAIGDRPIDMHLSALEKMGATIDLEGGYVIAHAQKLGSARIDFSFPSVGATENLMMAAAGSDAEVEIHGAAREPEIVILANQLRAMGATIEGDGTPLIKIQGTRNLGGTTAENIPDRIEAGTLLIAGAIPGNDVTVTGVDVDSLLPLVEVLQQMGADVTSQKAEQSIRVKGTKRPHPCDVVTQPHPGFPTDLQAQIMALACFADGTSRITETIFENRYMHVRELSRLGAKIRIDGQKAQVTGVEQLTGAPVMATDLRASASLVIAALAARGTTRIRRIYHLDRGYDGLDVKLQSLGAKVRRFTE